MRKLPAMRFPVGLAYANFYLIPTQEVLGEGMTSTSTPYNRAGLTEDLLADLLSSRR